MFVLRSRHRAVEEELRKVRKKLKRTRRALAVEKAVGATNRDEAQALSIENAVLRERLDLVANYLPGEPPAGRSELFVTEEQEDAQYLLETGAIDREGYAELLQEAGLLSHEVEIDAYGVPTMV